MKTKFYLLTILVAAATALGACSSDNGNDSELSNINMYVGDSVKVSPGTKAANEFVSFVMKNGYLYAFHVGTTTITSGGQQATVTVRGRYKAMNVLTDWTLTPDQLMARQGGTPADDDTDDGLRYIRYDNAGTANALFYTFKNDKLIAAMAYSSPSDMKEIMGYLDERYIFLPEEVDSYTYAAVDALEKDYCNTMVLVKLNTKLATRYMLQTVFVSYKAFMDGSFNSAKQVRTLSRLVERHQ